MESEMVFVVQFSVVGLHRECVSRLPEAKDMLEETGPGVGDDDVEPASRTVCKRATALHKYLLQIGVFGRALRFLQP